MPTRDQKWNNRSQGQKIRRAKEILGGLTEVLEPTTELVAQHDRDIKVLKSNDRSIEARLSSLERQRDREQG